MLTSDLQIVLLPKSYLLFCKTRVWAQNTILVIGYNKVVRIKDTAFKVKFYYAWDVSKNSNVIIDSWMFKVHNHFCKYAILLDLAHF